MIKTALFEEAKHQQSKITSQGKQGLFEEISSNYVCKFFLLFFFNCNLTKLRSHPHTLLNEATAFVGRTKPLSILL